jgi:hypothetical protein
MSKVRGVIEISRFKKLRGFQSAISMAGDLKLKLAEIKMAISVSPQDESFTHEIILSNLL